MRRTFVKGFFPSMPQGYSATYFTQLLSTMSFAVLFATLVLYMQRQLHLNTEQANIITGVYFAYNFTLHLLAGYLGGRFFSYRGLVVVGVIFQTLGCLLLAGGSVNYLYWGLSCMLVGTGTMVTCLNMLVSQLFQSQEVQRRESAFLWNYSSMNIGFILGFTLAGYFQLKANYTALFFTTAFTNFFALIALFFSWKFLPDRETILSKVTRNERIKRYSIGFIIVFCLVPLLQWLLRHAKLGDYLVLTVGVLMLILMIRIAFFYRNETRNRLFAFLILFLSAQVFWIIYQLAPMSLTVFAANNVNLHLWGFTIAPGWIQNINGFTISLGAPLLVLLFAYLRKRNMTISTPIQYTLGLFLSAISLLILPLGIAAGHAGYMAFSWLFITYILQAIAELLISPVGYSMVGELVPDRWQSLFMGSQLLNSGVAAVLASFFSNYASGHSNTTNPLITNPFYSHAFTQMGWFTVFVSIILFALIPILHRLMRQKKD